MLFILFLQHENHIEHIIYMNLPSDFVTRTRSLMGEEQFEKLAEALQQKVLLFPGAKLDIT